MRDAFIAYAPAKTVTLGVMRKDGNALSTPMAPSPTTNISSFNSAMVVCVLSCLVDGLHRKFYTSTSAAAGKELHPERLARGKKSDFVDIPA